MRPTSTQTQREFERLDANVRALIASWVTTLPENRK